MPNADNIIIGAATVYLDTVDVGYTKDGASIRNEREYVDVMADQAVGVVKKGRKSERMYVRTTFLEITLARLMAAWDQPLPANNSGSYYYMGYSNSCDVVEHTLKLIGSGPSCGTRSFLFHRVVGISEAEYKMERENEVGLVVEFECLKDPDNNNKFGWVLDS
jgi:hypothetical protein